MAPSWEVGIKANTKGLGHMTKMAARPYAVKNFKNLLPEQLSYDLKTWHAKSGSQALHVYIMMTLD